MPQDTHFHTSIDSLVIHGLAAIVLINLGRLGAARMVERGGRIGEIGKSIGGLL